MVHQVAGVALRVDRACIAGQLVENTELSLASIYVHTENSSQHFGVTRFAKWNDLLELILMLAQLIDQLKHICRSLRWVFFSCFLLRRGSCRDLDIRWLSMYAGCFTSVVRLS